MVTCNRLLQLTVPERLRGRIFAFYDVVWQSARLMSIGIGGVLADAIGIRAVYVLGGLLLLAAGALGLARLPAAHLLAAGESLAERVSTDTAANVPGTTP